MKRESSDFHSETETSTAVTPTRSRRGWAIFINRAVYGLSRRWLLPLSALWALYIGLPWLAPAFMQLGWDGAANAIYTIYTTQCHQLPQRSFFLFGPKAMYSLSEIQAAWQNTINPLVLRHFVGNAEMGWKVAWSDRMVSMYGATFFFGILWWPLRRRMKRLPLWGLVLLLLPMAIDGGTHLISDLAGIGQGFRESNAWLVALTANTLSVTFYAGDALGSFNSWMRLLSGTLFGLGVVWWAYPYFDEWFADIARELESKFQRAGLTLT